MVNKERKSFVAYQNLILRSESAFRQLGDFLRLKNGDILTYTSYFQCIFQQAA